MYVNFLGLAFLMVGSDRVNLWLAVLVNDREEAGARENRKRKKKRKKI